MRPDSQQVEVIGGNWLVSRILEDETPGRTAGAGSEVDLIAYVDLVATRRSVVRPNEEETATRARFGFDEKLGEIANLLTVFVWLSEQVAMP